VEYAKGKEIMKLSSEQMLNYEQDGFLFLPELFSSKELEILKRQLPRLFAEESERRVLEKGSGIVRSVYGSHQTNEVCRLLTCHPRLIEPAMQILCGAVYVYQFKVNAKAAFQGDIWEWHQDYIFWQREDGVPEPWLVTASLFLDEVNEFNGPLMIVPGSHKEGVIEPTLTGGVPAGYEESPNWIASLTADLKYSLNKDCLARLVATSGIVAPKGPAGSVLFFHPNVVHGSVPNMSPFDRRLMLITYNHSSNRQRANARPEFLASRDAEPLFPAAEDALLRTSEAAGAAV
jgi:ectoine hydroxylase